MSKRFYKYTVAVLMVAFSVFLFFYWNETKYDYAMYVGMVLMSASAILVTLPEEKRGRE